VVIISAPISYVADYNIDQVTGSPGYLPFNLGKCSISNLKMATLASFQRP